MTTKNRNQSFINSIFVLKTKNELIGQDKEFLDFIEVTSQNIEKSNSPEFTDPKTIIEIGKTIYKGG
jgi:hypothetical protein